MKPGRYCISEFTSVALHGEQQPGEREKTDQRCAIVAPGSLWCQGKTAQYVGVVLQTEENMFEREEKLIAIPSQVNYARLFLELRRDLRGERLLHRFFLIER